MEIGDLVRHKRVAWLNKEEWDITGLIVNDSDKGNNGKRTLYEVLWHTGLGQKRARLVKWHASNTLEIVNGNR